MSKRSTSQLSAELQRVIDYFRAEGRLTYAEIVGTLEIIKMDLLMETQLGEMLDEEEGEQG